jgi:hypothetical protein
MFHKLKIQKGIAIGISLLMVGSAGVPAFAKTEDMTIGACAKTYTSEFAAFMQTIIGFHGFGENFTETFKDIFGRNQCQAYDILMLEEQLDKVKNQIQTAYLNCKKEKVPKLEIAYYKTDAEIYYARHVVKTPFMSFRGLAPAGLGYKNLDEDEKEKLITKSLANRSTLFTEMMDKYSEKVGGESEFKKLFNDIEIKYSDRKRSYVICEGGGWEDVKAKIEEMIKNWGGAKEGVDTLKKEVGSGVEEVKRSAVDNNPESFGDFLGNTFEGTINGLSPEMGIDQITDKLKKSIPAVGDSPTVEDIFKASTSESERYDAELNSSLLRAKYEALYMGATDAAVLEYLRVLNEFQKTLLEGMVYLGKTFECTKKMAARQCGD